MPITITVAGEPRIYKQAVDDHYADQVDLGTTRIFKNTVDDTTVSLLRVSHDSKKNVERHYSSLEDIKQVDTNGTEDTAKSGITLTFRKGSATQNAKTQALFLAHVQWLSIPANLSEVMNGTLEM